MSGVATGAPPKRLGSFEILREIGQGGMGVVYLARQTVLERFVVLKKIRRALLVDASMIERFQREARAAAAIHHQNVVGVYDCFEARGDHYIAQEFVEGRDLRSILAQVGRLDPEVASLIALEVVCGLEEIHARGIVHRDLKPANILIGVEGDVKIADFGIAVDENAEGLTRPGILVGSIPYMAPEQILGQRADNRTDVFLFGILLYEMLAGAPPYGVPADGEMESLLERMQRERYPAPRIAAPGTPPGLVRLIRGCLRARPAHRTSSSTLLRLALERMLGRPSPLDCRDEIAQYLRDVEVFRTTEGRAPRRRRPRIAARRHLRWAVAALAGVVLVLAGTAARAPFRDEPRERPATPAAEIVSPVPRAPTPAPIVIPVEPARVRFVADPWAEVRVDGASGFVTPRASPLELAPGRHRVVFEHPTFGSAEIAVELKSGEDRTIRQVFAREAAK